MKKENLNTRAAIKDAVNDRIDQERGLVGNQMNGNGDDPPSPYFLSGGYLCRSKAIKEGGYATIKLANFTAQITEENIIDDGREAVHLYNIEGKLNGTSPLPKIDIPATNFSGLSWLSRWGSKACLEPGQTVKDFVRHAIQTGSNDVKVQTHFAHTGWRQINGDMVYLHAGGAIGGPGNVSVKLSRELERYSLPPIPPNEANSATRRECLAAALDFLDIGDRAVTLPIFCAVYLAPMTTLLTQQPNFSFYINGLSGTYKSTLAVLALSHFGHFPGVEGLSNFSDTVGILEKRSFTLKDTLHLIDDYHPSSNKRNHEGMENTAQRLIRNYSNRSARARLNADASEKGRFEPRGIMIMTAEELPTLESTLARICVVAVEEGSVDREKLTALQEKASLLPMAMALYIAWIKENMKSLQEAFPRRFREFRARAMEDGFHRKLPEQAAFMGFALEVAMEFFRESGMLTDPEAVSIAQDGWQIFGQLAARQQQRIKDDDPVDRFFDIIGTLLHQHNVKIDPMPSSCLPSIGAQDKVGFYDESVLYLIPTAAWHAVQSFCQKESTHFSCGRNTFFQMLQSKNIIATAPSGDRSHVIKIDGKALRVMKIIDGGVYRKTVTL